MKVKTIPLDEISLISLDNILIDKAILSTSFKCHLEKCKGACCVEGELGAPVKSEEVEAIERNLEKIKPYLPEKNLSAISEQGIFESHQGDLYLTTVGGRECVFAKIDEAGIALCMMEKSFEDGQSDFQKPISCHLFPIRVRQKFGMDFLAYTEIPECQSGLVCGAKEEVTMYEFLSGALRRKYGKVWTEKFLAYCRQVTKSQSV